MRSLIVLLAVVSLSVGQEMTPAERDASIQRLIRAQEERLKVLEQQRKDAALDAEKAKRGLSVDFDKIRQTDRLLHGAVDEDGNPAPGPQSEPNTVPARDPDPGPKLLPTTFARTRAEAWQNPGLAFRATNVKEVHASFDSARAKAFRANKPVVAFVGRTALTRREGVLLADMFAEQGAVVVSIKKDEDDYVLFSDKRGQSRFVMMQNCTAQMSDAIQKGMSLEFVPGKESPPIVAAPAARAPIQMCNSTSAAMGSCGSPATMTIRRAPPLMMFAPIQGGG